MSRSTKRVLSFRIYLFILFLHTCMFPAWCLHQRTCMTQGLVSGVFNETLTHECLQFEWFSVGYVFFMKVALLFFLECVSLSPLYPSFAFDIWYIVCVCVCWGGFGFHLQLFFLCVLEGFWISHIVIFLRVCVNECFEIFLCIYMSVSICVCVCMVHVLFNFGLNLSVNLFSNVWSSV